jgi:hypothetical protein
VRLRLRLGSEKWSTSGDRSSATRW